MDFSTPPPKKVRLFRKAIIKYYKKYGRKELPWRNTNNPWNVLLAELLLRKTTAKQVIPVYEKLVQLNITEISCLPRDKLEKILLPLGIYKERARLIGNIAALLSQQNSMIYYDVDKLMKIPGIGRYSAYSIQCFVFNAPFPALDRNMIRMIERVFSIKSQKKRPHLDMQLWDTAKKLVSPKNAREYNWGILDLGASNCRPKNPNCQNCCCKNFCDFYIVKENENEI